MMGREQAVNRRAFLHGGIGLGAATLLGSATHARQAAAQESEPRAQLSTAAGWCRRAGCPRAILGARGPSLRGRFPRRLPWWLPLRSPTLRLPIRSGLRRRDFLGTAAPPPDRRPPVAVLASAPRYRSHEARRRRVGLREARSDSLGQYTDVGRVQHVSGVAARNVLRGSGPRH